MYKYRNEIIVYLDDYQYSGGNRYKTIYLDFRTDDDFRKFKEAFSNDDTETVDYLRVKNESYIEIKEYLSPEPLVLGRYYALNVDLLNKLNPQLYMDSYLLLFSYEMSQNTGLLLLPHSPLLPVNLEYETPQQLSLPDLFRWDEDLKLKVNNVGQANWNEIIGNSSVYLVYDVGAPIHASKSDVKAFIERYATTYEKDKPYLVISHWDKDHIHCLYGMSDNELNYFSGIITVFNMKSRMSRNLFNRIRDVVGNQKLFSYKNPQRDYRYGYPRLRKIFENSGIWIFIGEECQNINYCGIIMVVSGMNNHVVFTGDCLYVQACYASRYAHLIGGAADGHILMVPHHGGKLSNKKIFNQYILPRPITPRTAIISVDQRNNSYGHPNAETITILYSVFGNNLDRTDSGHYINKYILKNL